MTSLVCPGNVSFDHLGVQSVEHQLVFCGKLNDVLRGFGWRGGTWASYDSLKKTLHDAQLNESVHSVLFQPQISVPDGESSIPKVSVILRMSPSTFVAPTVTVHSSTSDYLCILSCATISDHILTIHSPATALPDFQSIHVTSSCSLAVSTSAPPPLNTLHLAVYQIRSREPPVPLTSLFPVPPTSWHASS